MQLDGTLVPWESPDGTPMSLAVASPNIPWSELTYALAPNGNNLDYIEDAGYFGRIGVMKESYVQGLSTQGFKAPVGSDPRADIDGWKARLDAGEPYDDDPAVEAIDRRDQHLPLRLRGRPQRVAGAAADQLRVHRRSLPGQRGDPLLQPDPGRVPGQPAGAVLRLLRARPRPEPGQRARRPRGSRGRVARPLPEGHRSASRLRTSPPTRRPARTGPTAPVRTRPPTGLRSRPARSASSTTAARRRSTPNGGDTAVGADFNPLGATACTSRSRREEHGHRRLRAAPGTGRRLHGDGRGDGDREDHPARRQPPRSPPGSSTSRPDGTTKTLVERGLWRPTQPGPAGLPALRERLEGRGGSRPPARAAAP